jgi:catechol 2,3-dioxygenase-like lactoylglutathione lyase family enzyme
MLDNADVQPMLPVRDLKTAERFYEEILKLKKVASMPDTASVYQSGGTKLCVYRSEFAGTNKGTAALWEVKDVERTVKELKAFGRFALRPGESARVTFELRDDSPFVAARRHQLLQPILFRDHLVQFAFLSDHFRRKFAKPETADPSRLGQLGDAGLVGCGGAAQFDDIDAVRYLPVQVLDPLRKFGQSAHGRFWKPVKIMMRRADVQTDWCGGRKTG